MEPILPSILGIEGGTAGTSTVFAPSSSEVRTGGSVFDLDDDDYDEDELSATASQHVQPAPTSSNPGEEEEEGYMRGVDGSALSEFNSAGNGIDRLLAHAKATGAAHRAAIAAISVSSSSGKNTAAESLSDDRKSEMQSASSLSSALRESSSSGKRNENGAVQPIPPQNSHVKAALSLLREELSSTSPSSDTTVSLSVLNTADESEDVFRRVVGSKAPRVSSEETKKLRKLRRVDHTQITYPAITKDFYAVPPDVRALDEAEVRQLIKDLDGAKVKGNNAPRPLRTWDGCGLSDKILAVLERRGYATPFAVQSLAVPVLMSGRNLLVSAKTGSGKTLAYLLPLIRHASNQPSGGPGEGPIGLVLVPTHELAAQVSIVAKPLCHGASCRMVVSSGAVSLQENIRQCSQGCEVMIATPGRLVDLLTVSSGRVLSLFRTSFVVVDEADRLFDTGFMEHVEAFLRNVRPDKQVAMVSATMPRELRKIVMRHLHDPVEISVGGKPTPASNVEQLFYFFNKETYDVDALLRKPSERLLKLLEVLGNDIKSGENLALVFVNRKEEVDQLLAELSATGYNGRVATLHSGMDHLDRQCALELFTPKKQFILVATSVAERGLDIPFLDLVVNYSLPDHYEGYVHRIGRTGRAGRKGKAVSFFVKGVDGDISGDLCEGLERAGQQVPEELYEEAVSQRERRKAGYADRNAGFHRGFQHAKKQRFTPRDEREKLRDAARAMGLDEYLYEDEDDSDVHSSASDDSDTADGANSHDPEITPVVDGEIDTRRQRGGGPPSSALAVARGQNQLALSAADADNRVAAALQYAEKTTSISRGEATAATRFQRIYDINDLPDAVRRRLQSGVLLRSIAEETSTSIVRKGMFFDPKLKHSHKLKDGEEKLHLLIIGRTPDAIREAVSRLNKTKEEAKARESKKDMPAFAVQFE